MPDDGSVDGPADTCPVFLFAALGADLTAAMRHGLQRFLPQPCGLRSSHQRGSWLGQCVAIHNGDDDAEVLWDLVEPGFPGGNL